MAESVMIQGMVSGAGKSLNESGLCDRQVIVNRFCVQQSVV